MAAAHASSAPYTPSDETEETQQAVGRSNLRRHAGQDPAKFTPPPNFHHPAYGGPVYDGPYAHIVGPP